MTREVTMTGEVKIGDRTFALKDATLTVGDVGKIMIRGGHVAFTASNGSGHPVIATVPPAVNDGFGGEIQQTWTVTCEYCGLLGVWDNPLDALYTAQQH